MKAIVWLYFKSDKHWSKDIYVCAFGETWVARLGSVSGEATFNTDGQWEYDPSNNLTFEYLKRNHFGTQRECIKNLTDHGIFSNVPPEGA